MEVTITTKNQNVLLSRTEIRGTIVFEGPTPSNKQLMDAIGKQLDIDPSLIVVRKIRNLFGHQKAEFTAVAYHSKDAKERTEQLTSQMKKKIDEQKKAATAAQ